MFLYPYKIFTTARNKRVYTGNRIAEHSIHDCDRFNYSQAKEVVDNKNKKLKREQLEDPFKISILLGEVKPGVYLNVLDLDDCLDKDGNIEPLTKDLLDYFSPEEWEFSSSGTGIHIYILTTKIRDKRTIVKNIKGCKSFEWYADLRHIVTTTFDFENTNLPIGVHDDLLDSIVEEMKELEQSNNSFAQDVLNEFDGVLDNTEAKARGVILGRTPVEKISVLRECAFKDDKLRELIDADPSSVDQSQHDCRLIAKLLYYTLSYEGAWELAKKTNYYQRKDNKHKLKFDKPEYRERTNSYIKGGRY